MIALLIYYWYCDARVSTYYRLLHTYEYIWKADIEGGELIYHQGVSWYEHCELQLSN